LKGDIILPTNKPCVLCFVGYQWVNWFIENDPYIAGFLQFRCSCLSDIHLYQSMCSWSDIMFLCWHFPKHMPSPPIDTIWALMICLEV